MNYSINNIIKDFVRQMLSANGYVVDNTVLFTTAYKSFEPCRKRRLDFIMHASSVQLIATDFIRINGSTHFIDHCASIDLTDLELFLKIEQEIKSDLRI